MWLQDFNLRVQAENLLSNVKEVRRGHEVCRVVPPTPQTLQGSLLTVAMQDKKIIWVCHSLGGILLKEALIAANLNNQFIQISRATVGIVFLGTPHRGSATADVGTLVVNVAKCLTPGLRILYPSAVANLKQNSRVLFQIAGQFSNICSPFTIHSFHETKPLAGQIVSWPDNTIPSSGCRPRRSFPLKQLRLWGLRSLLGRRASISNSTAS